MSTDDTTIRSHDNPTGSGIATTTITIEGDYVTKDGTTVSSHKHGRGYGVTGGEAGETTVTTTATTTTTEGDDTCVVARASDRLWGYWYDGDHYNYDYNYYRWRCHLSYYC